MSTSSFVIDPTQSVSISQVSGDIGQLGSFISGSLSGAAVIGTSSVASLADGFASQIGVNLPSDVPGSVTPPVTSVDLTSSLSILQTTSAPSIPNLGVSPDFFNSSTTITTGNNSTFTSSSVTPTSSGINATSNAGAPQLEFGLGALGLALAAAYLV